MGGSLLGPLLADLVRWSQNDHHHNDEDDDNHNNDKDDDNQDDDHDDLDCDHDFDDHDHENLKIFSIFGQLYNTYHDVEFEAGEFLDNRGDVDDHPHGDYYEDNDDNADTDWKEENMYGGFVQLRGSLDPS